MMDKGAAVRILWAVIGGNPAADETEKETMKYFTQIRELAANKFQVVAGENPDDMKEVGLEPTYHAARKYRAWWVQSMGMQTHHVDHGFVPLVALQGHIPGH